MNDGDEAATGTEALSWRRRLETFRLKLSARGEQGQKDGNARAKRVSSAFLVLFLATHPTMTASTMNEGENSPGSRST